MNKKTQHAILTEEQLDHVLSLFESGIAIEDIIKQFPHHKDEVVDVLRTVSAIARDVHSITPPKELLSSVIERVTEPATARYSKRGVTSSIIGSLIYAFDSVAAHARIAVPAVAVVLLFVIFVANRPGAPTDTLPEGTQEVLTQYGDENSMATGIVEDSSGVALKSAAPQMMAMRALPPATGNPDDALGAFSETFSEEEILAAEGDTEIASFIADDGADVYQNFYEKEL